MEQKVVKGKKKSKKYYKVVLFEKEIITVLRKQVYVNVTSCTETGNKLYIDKGEGTDGEGFFVYPLEKISEYIVIPQKGKI